MGEACLPHQYSGSLRRLRLLGLRRRDLRPVLVARAVDLAPLVVVLAGHHAHRDARLLTRREKLRMRLDEFRDPALHPGARLVARGRGVLAERGKLLDGSLVCTLDERIRGDRGELRNAPEVPEDRRLDGLLRARILREELVERLHEGFQREILVRDPIVGDDLDLDIVAIHCFYPFLSFLAG